MVVLVDGHPVESTLHYQTSFVRHITGGEKWTVDHTSCEYNNMSGLSPRRRAFPLTLRREVNVAAGSPLNGAARIGGTPSPSLVPSELVASVPTLIQM
jgi:hypothetical protein